MKKRIGKKQWLAKALEILAESDVDEIKIDCLAQALGMSRSGFYYHFKNRDQFLDELLDYWEQDFTRIISSDSSIQQLSPEDRFEKVIEMVQELELSKYDLGIMTWSKKDSRARNALNRVFALRLAFVGKIFEDQGFTGSDLEIRTKLFVAYQAIANDIFEEHEDVKAKKSQIRQLKFLMVKPE